MSFAQIAAILLLNFGLVALFWKLLSNKRLLSSFADGRWWLTWLAISVITLMDELTSIFYAPEGAYRAIGYKAVIFIAITSVLMRFVSNRMVEISHILEENKLIGGGVYNFSYLVMGPHLSFIAVSSIFVTYVLTASISSVSAISNGFAFLHPSSNAIYIASILAIWGVAFLNIMGIKENARVTFYIFIGTTFVILNVVSLGLLDIDSRSIGLIQKAGVDSWNEIHGQSFFSGYTIFIANIASCILAYSGIESVLQTASLVRSWKEIKKAYTFLALTVGIITPLITALALTNSNVDIQGNPDQLLPHFAEILGGRYLSMAMSLVAFVTLVMAINTAYVASSELIERVSHRYNFTWILKTNKRDSLYLVHIGNALFYSFIIIITSAKIHILEEIYAIGLVASFIINMFALIVFRYRKGHTEAKEYSTSFVGTVCIFVLLVSCFIYLAIYRTHGLELWALTTVIFLALGIIISRKRSPELAEAAQGDSIMDLILFIGASDDTNIQIHFKRPHEQRDRIHHGLSAYVTLYSTRKPIPPKVMENHFRFPNKKNNVYNSIQAILSQLAYELPDRNVTIHFGWPASGWLDRLSTGVMTFQIMQLPKEFPQFNFKIERFAEK